MSGICGICRPGQLFGQNHVRAMLSCVAIDANEIQESLNGPSVTFGVARRFDGQDLKSTHRLSVVADTDLLNLSELRADVAAKGEASPDTVAGLLAALYSLYGTDFVHKLDGAFAFALWDETAQRLILAIDRLGIKNIYWKSSDSGLAFATRIGALRAFDPALELNQAALAQFMVFSAIPAPSTIYAGTQKMLPGSMAIFEQEQVRHRQYWDTQYCEEQRSESEWSELVRAELRASVHRHLRQADSSSTGAFLSGGTDSSTVVAFMSERHRPVRTFSAIFKEAAYSEENFVRTIAERFGTEQHDCCLSPQDVMTAMPRIFRYYDEPFANSSAIAAYYCAVAAQQSGVNVLLGGDGGDELFAGNERYSTDKRFALYHRIPRALRRALIEPAVKLLPREHKLGLARRYVERASIPNPQRYFSYNFFLSLPKEEIFSGEFLTQAPRERWLDIPQAHFDRPSQAAELNRLLYLDLKMTLADNDLKKVSGMAELAGIQVRYPLLDYRLAEVAARVPVDLKLRGFEKRHIFKRAMSGILPHEVLYKKKHGMGVPVSTWLLNDPQLHAFAQDVLHDSRTRQRNYFNRGFIERLLNLHRQEHVGYYGEIVWYLLALELWHREHFDYAERLVCAG